MASRITLRQAACIDILVASAGESEKMYANVVDRLNACYKSLSVNQSTCFLRRCPFRMTVDVSAAFFVATTVESDPGPEKVYSKGCNSSLLG